MRTYTIHTMKLYDIREEIEKVSITCIDTQSRHLFKISVWQTVSPLLCQALECLDGKRVADISALKAVLAAVVASNHTP